MKPTNIKYERLCNTGNYEHERYVIEVEVEEGDTATACLKKAKECVNRLIRGADRATREELRHAKKVLSHPNNYLYSEVEDAKKIIQDFEAREDEDDIPF